MSSELQQTFSGQGFAVLPGFRNAAQIASIRQRARELVDAYEPDGEQAVFSTQEQQRRVNDYFLGSAQTIRCFLEEEALDANGRLRQDKALSINKIGHAMHDLDPVFERFSHGSDLAAVAQDVGLLRPLVWQSMYIFKQPAIGGENRTVILWRRAVHAFAAADLAETHTDISATDAGRDRNALREDPCDALRREATAALRDLMGKTRCRVALK